MMLTKKQQTKSNRLKPKKVSTFGKKPFKGKSKNRKGRKKVTDEDKKYLSYLQTTDYPCMVCGKHYGIEWHHVKRDSTDKKDNTRLIPLCGVEHHRLGLTLSAHGTPKKFRDTFSIKFQLQYAKEIHDEFKISL